MRAKVPSFISILTAVFTGPNWAKSLAQAAGVGVSTAYRYRSGKMDMTVRTLWPLLQRSRKTRAELMAALRIMDELDAGENAVPSGSLGATARDVVRADRRLAGTGRGQPAALVNQ